MAIVAIARFEFIWLILVGTSCKNREQRRAESDRNTVIALILTITNTVAFSRCDKFSQASNLASSLNSGGIASSLMTGMLGRMFR